MNEQNEVFGAGGNFTSTNEPQDEQSNATQNSGTAIAKDGVPKYCKESCKNCDVKRFKFDSLISLHAASQIEIINELVNHGHPSSLKMQRNKQRSLKQAISQLMHHLEFVHKIKF
jgi:hypothetical protein